jgi:hypothetical protein
MRTTHGLLAAVLSLGMILGGLPPLARATEPAPPEDQPGDEAGSSVGLIVELGLKTAYMFRGANLLSTPDAPGAQRPVANPLIVWLIGDTGLSLTYFGAFQLDGVGRAYNRENALDLEQDLILGYTLALGAGFSLQATLSWLVWPFADRAVMGSSLPSVVEPLVGVSWSGPLDVGLRVSYFHGVPGSLDFLRYAYVNPWLAKRLELSPDVALVAGAGFGIKAWVNGQTDNMLDVALSVELPIQLGRGFYLRPGLYFSWTNLDRAADDRGLSFRDEISAWAGLAAGVEL